MAISLLRANPFDIEVRRVAAGFAIFENIPPPAVTADDCHVVRNDIQHLTKPEFLQRCNEALLRFLAPQFVVDALEIDDVISMRASGSGLQEGGAVNVRNSEVTQIWRDKRSIIERESRLKLDSVCGERCPQ